MFGMIPFAKAAGRGLGKLFGKDKKEAEDTLKKEVEGYGLDSSGIDIHVNEDGTVDVKGEAVSQEVKEKIILAVGNVEGVGGLIKFIPVKFYVFRLLTPPAHNLPAFKTRHVLS